jgi:hypothetical protein
MAFTVAAFFNVQGSVGRNGHNSETDVMLVQYMLFHACIQSVPNFTRNIGNFPVNSPGIGPGAIFPTNGVYTSELDEWIRSFQRTANQSGLGPLTEDGRVDRAPVGWGKGSSAAGTWYTIQALNYVLFTKAERPYSTLADFSDVPPRLAQELKLVVLPGWTRA